MSVGHAITQRWVLVPLLRLLRGSRPLHLFLLRTLAEHGGKRASHESGGERQADPPGRGDRVSRVLEDGQRHTMIPCQERVPAHVGQGAMLDGLEHGRQAPCSEAARALAVDLEDDASCRQPRLLAGAPRQHAHDPPVARVDGHAEAAGEEAVASLRAHLLLLLRRIFPGEAEAVGLVGDAEPPSHPSLELQQRWVHLVNLPQGLTPCSLHPLLPQQPPSLHVPCLRSSGRIHFQPVGRRYKLPVVAGDNSVPSPRGEDHVLSDTSSSHCRSRLVAREDVNLVATEVMDERVGVRVVGSPVLLPKLSLLLHQQVACPHIELCGEAEEIALGTVGDHDGLAKR
mmetsp:Transcript_29371/g.94278  ORF Transcript_29371/g.94278 Transcript_29371/m.94278 type:complete len:342 (-) Transcript_29371:11-1036(-)